MLRDATQPIAAMASALAACGANLEQGSKKFSLSLLFRKKPVRHLLIIFVMVSPLLQKSAIADAANASDVFRKASQSAVLIVASNSQSKLQGSGIAYRYTYSSGPKPTPVSTWIVTSEHVIHSATKIQVSFDNDQQFDAAVEYRDAQLDLAILSVPYVAPVLAKTSGIQVIHTGDRIFSIGSPLGLRNTITEGIVSGVRERGNVKIVQTTAPISQGNSGGGLFDANSQLVAITAFKLNDGEGLGFGVDAAYVSRIDRAILVAALLRASMPQGTATNPQQKADLRYIQSPTLIKWMIDNDSPTGVPMADFIWTEPWL